MDEFDEFLESNSEAMAAIEKLRNKVLHAESGRQSGHPYPYFLGELIKVYFRHMDAIVKTQYWIDMHLRHIRTQLNAARIDSDAALPLPPINDWIDRGGIHTPMPSRMIWPCMQAMADLERPAPADGARSDPTLSVYEKAGYLTMLIRFSVLINETLHQTFFMTPEDGSDQQAHFISGPMRVGIALLHPALETYARISSTHTDMKSDLLDHVVRNVDFMRTLRQSRNALFHITKHSINTDDLGTSLLRPTRELNVEQVATALLAFLAKLK
ncbi:MAG: hypothetical protein OXF79_21570 [Chloroflexi bacterium]|nr:hypothetical protein [Chloroflexota bacterium]